jgi:hypothetical protein
VATSDSANSARELAEKAVALAAGNGAGDAARSRAALITQAGDEQAPLEQARDLLVRRIRMRSDDFPATYGLSLLNGALSQLGKKDDLSWKPRVWKLPR